MNVLCIMRHSLTLELATCSILHMPNYIGQNIRRAREAKNWDQETLAIQALGSSQNQGQLSRWENGVNVPTIPNLQRLASALSLSVADLLHDASSQQEAV